VDSGRRVDGRREAWTWGSRMLWTVGGCWIGRTGERYRIVVLGVGWSEKRLHSRSFVD